VSGRPSFDAGHGDATDTHPGAPPINAELEAEIRCVEWLPCRVASSRCLRHGAPVTHC
jgi:hypothetical protein